QAAELGRLDPEAIARVREEAWPEARNADELGDALALLGFATAEEGADNDWQGWFAELEADGRAARFTTSRGVTLWAAAERLAELGLALPDGRAADGAVVLPAKVADADTALRELVRSRMEAL